MQVSLRATIAVAAVDVLLAVLGSAAIVPPTVNLPGELLTRASYSKFSIIPSTWLSEKLSESFSSVSVGVLAFTGCGAAAAPGWASIASALAGLSRPVAVAWPKPSKFKIPSIACGIGANSAHSQCIINDKFNLRHKEASAELSRGPAGVVFPTCSVAEKKLEVQREP